MCALSRLSDQVVHAVNGYIPQMTDCDVAWAAGFYEGEGGAYPGVRCVMLRVVQSDREPLERFARIVGCGTIRRTATSALGTRPMFAWQVARRADVDRIVDLFWPWLSPRKRTQVDRARAQAA